MKIIIAGAGEVGTHLAKLLSREEQDIILIDNDEEKLRELDANYNLMTVIGNPTAFQTLKQAQVYKADLFIAVMPFESRNIMACTMASKLGAKKTLARVDNYEYLLPENKAFFENLGVNELIYPEKLAAEEVITALKHTWTRNWFELCNGELIVLSVKLHDNAKILNKKLYELTTAESQFHIAAIKRIHETIIPRGNDEIKIGDIAYFTTTPNHIQEIQKLSGETEAEIHKIMIIGCIRISIRISSYAPDNMAIKLIECDKQKSYKLAEYMNDIIIIQGDGRNVDLLKEEGIRDMDAFIALTDSSETNILACLTAKELGVKKTIAEVENIQFISTAERLNIGNIINKKLLAASRIFQLLLDEDSSNAKCLALSDAEVVELVAKENSKITKAAVKDLKLPSDLTIGGLVRNGHGMVVTGNTWIQPNDHVVIFCLDTALHKIEKLFN